MNIEHLRKKKPNKNNPKITNLTQTLLGNREHFSILFYEVNITQVSSTFAGDKRLNIGHIVVMQVYHTLSAPVYNVNCLSGINEDV